MTKTRQTKLDIATGEIEKIARRPESMSVVLNIDMNAPDVWIFSHKLMNQMAEEKRQRAEQQAVAFAKSRGARLRGASDLEVPQNGITLTA